MIDFDAYPPLVEASELAAYPGAPFDANVVAVAGDVIRRYCEWHIAPTWSETLTLNCDGGRLLVLPTLHLTDVTAVRDRKRGVALTGWEYSVEGLIEWDRCFPRGLRAIEVDVEHGLPVAPPGLLAVVAEVATELKSLMTGIGQVSLDGAAVQYTTSQTSGDGISSKATALSRFKLWPTH